MKKILIAGIGNGSLGLELLKCLLIDTEYLIYGTDSNPNASGFWNKSFKKTFVTRSGNNSEYLNDILEFAKTEKIEFVVPGSEVTNKIITENQELFKRVKITPLVNNLKVFNLCSDKIKCNEYLKSAGLNVPEATNIKGFNRIEFSKFPCVIKPSLDSGASNMVFIAENHKEAKFFANYISLRGSDVCIQEYITGDEFTVGVMSSLEGKIISSVALKRDFSSKLSRVLKYDDRIISSGWSQGLIDDFGEVTTQCEHISSILGSTWALNIQGRMRDGIFYPFEINPRHSGTSYFRALSGINELSIGINSILRKKNQTIKLKPGLYHRILGEVFSSKIS